MLNLPLVAHTYSFFLRAGSVGANFIFCVPNRVVPSGFFTKLPIAFGTVGGATPEPDAAEDAPAVFPPSSVFLDTEGVRLKSDIASRNQRGNLETIPGYQLGLRLIYRPRK